MNAYPNQFALTLYAPPQTALAVIPRKQDPIPAAVPLTVAYGRWLYDEKQTVVIPSTHYTIGRHWETMAVTRYQEARIVGRWRLKTPTGYENWYTVHVGRSEGNAFGYKAFGIGVREADIHLDLRQATHIERRIVPTPMATTQDTRLGSHLAA
jgi:hypothetical protein